MINSNNNQDPKPELDKRNERLLQKNLDRLGYTAEEKPQARANFLNYLAWVAETESKFDTDRTSNTGAKGVFQFTTGTIDTARERMKNPNAMGLSKAEIAELPLDAYEWTYDQAVLHLMAEHFVPDGSDAYLRGVFDGTTQGTEDAYRWLHLRDEKQWASADVQTNVANTWKSKNYTDAVNNNIISPVEIAEEPKPIYVDGVTGAPIKGNDEWEELTPEQQVRRDEYHAMKKGTEVIDAFNKGNRGGINSVLGGGGTQDPVNEGEETHVMPDGVEMPGAVHQDPIHPRIEQDMADIQAGEASDEEFLNSMNFDSVETPGMSEKERAQFTADLGQQFLLQKREDDMGMPRTAPNDAMRQEMDYMLKQQGLGFEKLYAQQNERKAGPETTFDNPGQDTFVPSTEEEKAALEAARSGQQLAEQEGITSAPIVTGKPSKLAEQTEMLRNAMQATPFGRMNEAVTSAVNPPETTYGTWDIIRKDSGFHEDHVMSNNRIAGIGDYIVKLTGVEQGDNDEASLKLFSRVSAELYVDLAALIGRPLGKEYSEGIEDNTEFLKYAASVRGLKEISDAMHVVLSFGGRNMEENPITEEELGKFKFPEMRGQRPSNEMGLTDEEYEDMNWFGKAGYNVWVGIHAAGDTILPGFIPHPDVQVDRTVAPIGNIAGTIGGFMLGMKGFDKALQGRKWYGGLGAKSKAFIQGALQDMSYASRAEGNASRMVLEQFPDSAAADTFLVKFLATELDDPQWEIMVKEGVEGGILGELVMLTVSAAKWGAGPLLKKLKKTKTKVSSKTKAWLNQRVTIQKIKDTWAEEVGKKRSIGLTIDDVSDGPGFPGDDDILKRIKELRALGRDATDEDLAELDYLQGDYEDKAREFDNFIDKAAAAKPVIEDATSHVDRELFEKFREAAPHDDVSDADIKGYIKWRRELQNMRTEVDALEEAEAPIEEIQAVYDKMRDHQDVMPDIDNIVKDPEGLSMTELELRDTFEEGFKDMSNEEKWLHLTNAENKTGLQRALDMEYTRDGWEAMGYTEEMMDKFVNTWSLMLRVQKKLDDMVDAIADGTLLEGGIIHTHHMRQAQEQMRKLKGEMDKNPLIHEFAPGIYKNMSEGGDNAGFLTYDLFEHNASVKAYMDDIFPKVREAVSPETSDKDIKEYLYWERAVQMTKRAAKAAEEQGATEQELEGIVEDLTFLANNPPKWQMKDHLDDVSPKSLEDMFHGQGEVPKSVLDRQKSNEDLAKYWGKKWGDVSKEDAEQGTNWLLQVRHAYEASMNPKFPAPMRAAMTALVDTLMRNRMEMGFGVISKEFADAELKRLKGIDFGKGKGKGPFGGKGGFVGGKPGLPTFGADDSEDTLNELLTVLQKQLDEGNLSEDAAVSFQEAISQLKRELDVRANPGKATEAKVEAASREAEGGGAEPPVKVKYEDGEWGGFNDEQKFKKFMDALEEYNSNPKDIKNKVRLEFYYNKLFQENLPIASRQARLLNVADVEPGAEKDWDKVNRMNSRVQAEWIHKNFRELVDSRVGPRQEGRLAGAQRELDDMLMAGVEGKQLEDQVKMVDAQEAISEMVSSRSTVDNVNTWEELKAFGRQGKRNKITETGSAALEALASVLISAKLTSLGVPQAAAIGGPMLRGLDKLAERVGVLPVKLIRMLRGLETYNYRNAKTPAKYGDASQNAFRVLSGGVDWDPKDMTKNVINLLRGIHSMSAPSTIDADLLVKSDTALGGGLQSNFDETLGMDPAGLSRLGIMLNGIESDTPRGILKLFGAAVELMGKKGLTTIDEFMKTVMLENEVNRQMLVQLPDLFNVKTLDLTEDALNSIGNTIGGLDDIDSESWAMISAELANIMVTHKPKTFAALKEVVEQKFARTELMIGDPKDKRNHLLNVYNVILGMSNTSSSSTTIINKFNKVYDDAIEYTRRIALTQDPIDGIGGIVTKLLDVGSSAPGRIVKPFTRTMVNAATVGAEHVPLLNLLLKQERQVISDLMKGKGSSIDQARMTGRMLVGGTLIATINHLFTPAHEVDENTGIYVKAEEMPWGPRYSISIPTSYEHFEADMNQQIENFYVQNQGQVDLEMKRVGYKGTPGDFLKEQLPEIKGEQSGRISLDFERATPVDMMFRAAALVGNWSADSVSVSTEEMDKNPAWLSNILNVFEGVGYLEIVNPMSGIFGGYEGATEAWVWNSLAQTINIGYSFGRSPGEALTPDFRPGQHSSNAEKAFFNTVTGNLTGVGDPDSIMKRRNAFGYVEGPNTRAYGWLTSKQEMSIWEEEFNRLGMYKRHPKPTAVRGMESVNLLSFKFKEDLSKNDTDRIESNLPEQGINAYEDWQIMTGSSTTIITNPRGADIHRPSSLVNINEYFVSSKYTREREIFLRQFEKGVKDLDEADRQKVLAQAEVAGKKIDKEVNRIMRQGQESATIRLKNMGDIYYSEEYGMTLNEFLGIRKSAIGEAGNPTKEPMDAGAFQGLLDGGDK